MESPKNMRTIRTQARKEIQEYQCQHKNDNGKMKSQQRICNRSDVILAKVESGKEWLEIYREFMRAKEALKKITGVRKTRNGNILFELK
jgi:hypothetical protein